MSPPKRSARVLSTVSLAVALVAFVLAAAQLLYLYVGLSESYARLLFY